MIKRIYKRLKAVFYKSKFKNKSAKEVFTTIHDSNYWGDSESVSGEGSNLIQTNIIREELSTLFINYNINSILDIPCGDFYWMSKLNLDNLNYIGADIVEGLIIEVQNKYSSNSKNFKVLNLIEDELPCVDLIFVRDCLVHLSYSDINESIKNIKKSKSKYLLTTSFIAQTRNKDIITGDWRTLNLQAEPFNFPKPILVIDEKSSESGGLYQDKSLLLWLIDSLPDS